MHRPQSVAAGRAAACLALLLCLAAMVAPAVAADRQAVSFELEVLPAAKRYVELAAYPSYLAVALKNNGFSPSQSGMLILKDGRTLRFQYAELTFVRQDKGIFHYKTTLEWSFGVGLSRFEIPAQIDMSKVGDGKVVVGFSPPLANLFPDKVTEGMRRRIQSLAAPAVQKRMLEYFDGLPSSKDSRIDTARMFERIMFDSHNLAAVAPGLSGAREPGDAEPLADQWMLLATLAFWLVIVPGFFAGRAAWRMRKAHRGVSK